MAAEAPPGLGEKADEVHRHVHGLDRADAEAAGRLARRVQLGRLGEQTQAEVGQIQAVGVVGSQVDAREHDFPHPGPR